MKKLLLIQLVLLLSCAACKPKIQPKPEPEEFFSFYADGEYYYYPQVRKSSLGGNPIINLKAYSSHSSRGYIISATSDADPVASGGFGVFLSGGSFPDKDTMLLGKVFPRVEILNFRTADNDFYTRVPNSGKVIFSERTTSRIIGIFYFEATSKSGDTIHITEGKFSIKPSNL